jgi:hypothetical protein
MILRLYFVNDPIGHGLLGYLTIVNLLLHCMIGDETINETVLLLTISKDATHSLSVMTRIPRSIEDNDSIGANQIDPEASGTSREQK